MEKDELFEKMRLEVFELRGALDAERRVSNSLLEQNNFLKSIIEKFISNGNH